MNDILIKQFINNMTLESGIAFAKKYNIEFNKNEANYLVPFLKKNVNYLNKENKQRLLSIIKKDIDQKTYEKVLKLLDKLIK